jgi:hypothetical protein
VVLLIDAAAHTNPHLATSLGGENLSRILRPPIAAQEFACQSLAIRLITPAKLCFQLGGTKMKRVGFLIGAAGFLAAATAFAGYTSLTPVTITSTDAVGTVAGAYQASDPNQEINCTTLKYSTGLSQGFCFAYDSNNASKMCVTTDPDMIAVMQSVGPMSLIGFSLASDHYTCASVTVGNGTRYAAY